MFKKILAALAALLAATAFAAVDVNKASQTELESISGIGPAISANIISERKKGDFKDWNDLVVRIKGVGENNAAKFSQGGLTVNGKAFAGAPAEPAKATTAKVAATDKSGVDKAASSVKGSPKVLTETVKEEAHAAKQSVVGAKGKGDEKAVKASAEDKSGVAKAASAVKGSPKVVAENAKGEATAAKESVADAKAKSAEKKAAKAEAKAEKAAADSALKASAPKK